MIIPFPELRQASDYDCGTVSFAAMLSFAGIYEREDRLMKLLGTTRNGTPATGILRGFDYYGLPYRSGKMTTLTLRRSIYAGHPTLIVLQAYRSSSRRYKILQNDGHYVVGIGRKKRRFIFEDPSAYVRTWLADDELNERWHDHALIHWGCTLLAPACPPLCVHMD